MEADARISRWLWVILLIGLLLRLAYAMDSRQLRPLKGLAVTAVGTSRWAGASSAGKNMAGSAIFPSPIIVFRRPLISYTPACFSQLLPDHVTVVVLRLSAVSCIDRHGISGVPTWIDAGRSGCGSWRRTRHLSSALIFEPANIATETLYIFFLLSGLCFTWIRCQWIGFASRQSIESRAALFWRRLPSVWRL